MGLSGAGLLFPQSVSRLSAPLDPGGPRMAVLCREDCPDNTGAIQKK